MVILWNLIQWDNELFDAITLPEGIDRGILVDTITRKYGGCTVAIESPNIFRYYVERFFEQKEYNYRKLLETLNYEYDAIENYNRMEDGWENNQDTEHTTDVRDEHNTMTEGLESARNTTREDTSNATNNSTTTGEVSPYNAETYLNDVKSTANDNSNAATNANENENVNSTKNNDVKNNMNYSSHLENDREKKYGIHAHGNIGVTTTQQMIEQEREVVKFDIYEYIAADFASEFIILVW